jgi:hypothetical protein
MTGAIVNNVEVVPARAAAEASCINPDVPSSDRSSPATNRLKMITGGPTSLGSPLSVVVLSLA